MIENIEGRNSQLLHKLHKLEQEHEDLVERNEELESILGETQIQTKQDKEQFESEVEGLHRKVSKEWEKCCLVLFNSRRLSLCISIGKIK